MPKVSKLVFRRSTIGLAWSTYRLWRRIPPAQRKRLLEQGRKHGPRIVEQAVKSARRGKK